MNAIGLSSGDDPEKDAWTELNMVAFVLVVTNPTTEVEQKLKRKTSSKAFARYILKSLTDEAADVMSKYALASLADPGLNIWEVISTGSSDEAKAFTKARAWRNLCELLCSGDLLIATNEFQGCMTDCTQSICAGFTETDHANAKAVVEELLMSLLLEKVCGEDELLTTAITGKTVNESIALLKERGLRRNSTAANAAHRRRRRQRQGRQGRRLLLQQGRRQERQGRQGPAQGPRPVRLQAERAQARLGQGRRLQQPRVRPRARRPGVEDRALHRPRRGPLQEGPPLPPPPRLRQGLQRQGRRLQGQRGSRLEERVAHAAGHGAAGRGVRQRRRRLRPRGPHGAPRQGQRLRGRRPEPRDQPRAAAQAPEPARRPGAPLGHH